MVLALEPLREREPVCHGVEAAATRAVAVCASVEPPVTASEATFALFASFVLALAIGFYLYRKRHNRNAGEYTTIN